MTKVFIDGSAGTTGLRIRERLAARGDISLLTLPEETRKDPAARHEMLKSADIAFLCLPDAAAAEAAELAADCDVAIIDTSTAHRTDPAWAYGFPELGDRRAAIAGAKRVANPGCHASGFLALIEPLVREGLIAPDTALCCFSLTGYSGGGKKMIAEYEDAQRPALFDAPRQYGAAQSHKHLPEMCAVAGLTVPPVFCPVVGDFYSGMEVTVPLFKRDCRGTSDDIRALYADLYHSPILHYSAEAGENGFLSAAAFAGRDDMEVCVLGNSERILLVSRFDNLGKGASGAAIQNMNILLGIAETTGLVTEASER